MKIKYVTLTGADDQIDPKDLGELSKEFPFVEWAILFSQSKAGVPRYPSYDWVKKLFKTQESYRMNLAAHLCGKWVDDVIKGHFTFLADPTHYNAFSRIQLNMSSDRILGVLECEPLHQCVKKYGKEVILGGNYSRISVSGAFFEETGLFPLFDASGGKGILAKDWPQPFKNKSGEALFCGYAGGLKPDNLSEQINKIGQVVDSAIWIDMETGIRTKSDNFDLAKCRQALEIVCELIE